MKRACHACLTSDEREALAAVYVQAAWRKVQTERSALEAVVEALDDGGRYTVLIEALQALSAGNGRKTAARLQDLKIGDADGLRAIRNVIGAVARIDRR